MRILYIQQLLIPPGSSGNARSWEFAKSWARQGHEIHILTSYAHLPPTHNWRLCYDYPDLTPIPNLRVHVLEVDYHHMMGFGRRIWSFLQFFLAARRKAKHLPAPDAVLAYSTPWSVAELGRQVARYFQVPYFLEIADVWPEVPAGMNLIPLPGLVKWMHRKTDRMYREATRIFPFSPGMASQIHQRGVPETKISTILNGTRRVRPSHPSHSFHGPVTVVYTGTFGVANDVGQILQAAKILWESGNQEIRFIVVGDGNEGKKVRAQWEALHLPNVELHERVSQSEAMKIMESADIGLVCFANFPVLEHNAATKFFDYLGQGLPVVINYEGWQAEWLRTYQCGLSAHQGDLMAFAEAIAQLASNPQLRSEMSSNALQLAQEKFQRDQLSQDMLNHLLAVKHT
ncbi:glycosyltransferase family 4 protein [Pontibacter sp. G13]|uniref:glycosyltransferase family 4 protein n=1 Tax=Pontibacter sp. G13 TaxID=3074898 RepID=UPI00288AA087|nr:glycosyltransferase family 4 protein [Pontibacter sp. G13]WNJ20389.1 glycosyltransferase family 4 protein [Pontibacter sp. G13]